MVSREITKRRLDQAELWRWARPSAVKRGEWLWPSFTPQEMACQDTQCVLIDPNFMDKLQSMRTAVAVPLPVTSGYRSPKHNQAVSSTNSLVGPHPDCQAVDLAVRFTEAYEVIKAAPSYGFIGIGALQHGKPLGRFVHLDCWVGRKNPAFWTYDAS